MSLAFIQGLAVGFLACVAVVIIGFFAGLILGGRKTPMLPYGSMPQPLFPMPPFRRRRKAGS